MSSRWFESDCQLFKQSLRNEEWLKYDKSAKLTFSHFSFSIRDSSTQTLLCDFPFLSISEILVVNTLLVKIVPKQPVHVPATESAIRSGFDSFICYGIKFNNEKSTQDFLAALERNSVKILTSDEMDSTAVSQQTDYYPDVRDPATQELIVKLLFDEQFKNFVSEMSSLLDAVAKET
jgi:hypothetical protein